MESVLSNMFCPLETNLQTQVMKTSERWNLKFLNLKFLNLKFFFRLICTCCRSDFISFFYTFVSITFIIKCPILWHLNNTLDYLAIKALSIDIRFCKLLYILLKEAFLNRNRYVSTNSTNEFCLLNILIHVFLLSFFIFHINYFALNSKL